MNAQTNKRIAGLVKHPMWVGIGTVVGVLAIVAWALSSTLSKENSDGRVSIAAVTLGEPTVVDAKYIEPNGDVSTASNDGVMTAPVDITFKNNGGATASIDSVSVSLIKGKMVGSCARQGAGGVDVAANYALQIPRSQFGEEAKETQPVSDTIAFEVQPGQTARVAVTVGPTSQAENTAMIMAFQLTFGVSDGSTLVTDPIIIGTTPAIIDTLTSEASNLQPGESAFYCKDSLANLDDVVAVGGLVADPVQKLREVYGRVA